MQRNVGTVPQEEEGEEEGEGGEEEEEGEGEGEGGEEEEEGEEEEGDGGGEEEGGEGGEVEAGEVSVCVLVQVKWPLFPIRAHLPILSLFAMTTVLYYFVNTHSLSLSDRRILPWLCQEDWLNPGVQRIKNDI